MRRSVPLQLLVLLLPALAAGRASAQPHAPAEVKNPPAPVVGRDAEWLPDHGGPVLELFRLKLPERPWLSHGVKLGRSVMRFGFAFEAGWQSSVLLYTPWNHYDSDQPTPVLRLVSQVRLASVRPLGRGAVKVRYGLEADLGTRQQLESMDDGNPQSLLMDARTAGRLELDFGRRAILGVEANFARVNQQIYGGPGVYEMDYLDSRLSLRIPLRNDRLSLGLRYRFAAWRPVLDIFHDLRQQEHDLQLRFQWRLPFKWRVGFMVEAGYVALQTIPYFVDGDEAVKRRVFPVRGMLELAGIIGPRLSFTLGLGYGFAVLQWDSTAETTFGTWDKPAELHHGLVAHLGISMQLSERTRLGLGVWHDFRAETGAAKVTTVDTWFLSLTALPWRRLSLQLTTAYVSRQPQLDGSQRSGQNQYGFIMPTSARISLRGLTEPHVLVRAVADWYVLSWLSVGAAYQLQRSVGESIRIPSALDPSEALIIFRRSYVQHRVLGRVAMRY